MLDACDDRDVCLDPPYLAFPPVFTLSCLYLGWLGDNEMQRCGWLDGWIFSCCAINLLLLFYD